MDLRNQATDQGSEPSHFGDLDIAVLLPCYNEAASIAQVVLDFRRALPGQRIYVYDNNSSDGTAEQAARAGAIVRSAPRPGKGTVVRRMFADIDADIYIMADGDGTYDISAAPTLIRALVENHVDMVVGTRDNVHVDAGRAGHAFGNRLFNAAYRAVFGNDFSDIFSGYRVFTRRYAKSFPALSPGFEIETEMSVFASSLRLPTMEIGTHYGVRGEDSESKLSSLKDGLKILRMIARLFKETKPLVFFSYIALAMLGVSLLSATPVLIEYFQTGLVERMPTWVMSMSMLLASLIVFSAGVVLDTVVRGQVEARRHRYLSVPAARGEKSMSATPLNDRRDPARPARVAARQA